jgi:hypothetical protein
VAAWLRPNAPRFHALLERREGRPIFMMSRPSWESLKLAGQEPVLLTMEQLGDTPLASPPSFLFGSARRTTERVEMSLYRVDLEDAPNLINIDTYEVWEELPARIDVPGMVTAASTNTNANFSRYLGEHVFLAKEQPGSGHHLPSLPDQVVALLKRLGDAV